MAIKVLTTIDGTSLIGNTRFNSLTVTSSAIGVNSTTPPTASIHLCCSSGVNPQIRITTAYGDSYSSQICGSDLAGTSLHIKASGYVYLCGSYSNALCSNVNSFRQNAFGTFLSTNGTFNAYNCAQRFMCSLLNSCTTLSFCGVEKLRTIINGVCIVGCSFATDHQSTSDGRLKHNWTHIEDPISKVKNLCGRKYLRYDNFEDPEQYEYGFIAQEVEKIIPELVSNNKIDLPEVDNGLSQLNSLYQKLEMDSVKSISYEKVTAILTEAVKEQQKEIDELKGRIKLLEEKINNI